MTTPADTLLTPEKRPVLVRDCETLIEQEVSDKKGVSGLAIKAGFKTVRAFKPGIIPDVVDLLLPEFVAAVEPFHAEFVAQGGGDFAAHCVAHGGRIAEALLGITDRRAEKSKHRTLVKAYQKLRPKAHEHVVSAMPRLGALLVKHGL